MNSIHSFLTGIYVGLDHGIWIGLLLRKTSSDIRRKIIAPISTMITILQMIACYYIRYVQNNPIVMILSSLILIITALQLYVTMPSTRSDRTFFDTVRIAILIVFGGLDNLIAISTSTNGVPLLIVLSAGLSFPLIIFTVNYLVPLVVDKLWFFLSGIALLSFSAGKLLMQAVEYNNFRAELFFQVILLVLILWGGSTISKTPQNRV